MADLSRRHLIGGAVAAPALAASCSSAAGRRRTLRMTDIRSFREGRTNGVLHYEAIEDQVIEARTEDIAVVLIDVWQDRTFDDVTVNKIVPLVRALRDVGAKVFHTPSGVAPHPATVETSDFVLDQISDVPEHVQLSPMRSHPPLATARPHSSSQPDSPRIAA